MNYHNITYPDQNNGDGLRVTLWLSGCSHRCYNCHNSETWGANSGIIFDKNAEEELFTELDKDYISGLTLSGGDPLFDSNLNEVCELVKKFRLRYGNTKTIWIYTGFCWNQIFNPKFSMQNDAEIKDYLSSCKIRKEIISNCDVIIDGKYVDELRDVNLHWCGSSNQRVIDVKKTLENGSIVLYCE